jgi:hypothetical protein
LGIDPRRIQHDSLLVLKLRRRCAYCLVDRMNVLLSTEEVEVLRGWLARPPAALVRGFIDRIGLAMWAASGSVKTQEGLDLLECSHLFTPLAVAERTGAA